MFFSPSTRTLILCTALSTILLAGCGQGVKKSLGLERNNPDEFAVIERAPLTLPPNYDLVAPQPGAPRPQEASSTNTARGLILRSETSAPKAQAGLSGAENALLNKAGATSADPNIRKELFQDKEVNEDPNRPVIEKLGLKGSAEKGKALNATEENARLKQKKIKSPSPVPIPKKK
jgi:hypothetical protein